MHLRQPIFLVTFRYFDYKKWVIQKKVVLTPETISSFNQLKWQKSHQLNYLNRPFSKMAAENSNKSKLKPNGSTRKSTLTLVTLPSLRISGEISAEKMYVENCKIYRRLYDWGYNAYNNIYCHCSSSSGYFSMPRESHRKVIARL